MPDSESVAGSSQIVSPEKKKLPWGAFFLVFAFLLVLSNLLLLNYQAYFQIEKQSQVQPTGVLPVDPFGLKPLDDQETVPSLVPDSGPEEDAGGVSAENDSCSQACLEAISQATTSKQTDQSVPEPISVAPAVKEIYIPLGSSSTTNKTYSGLVGIEAVIDATNYSGTKSIIFEASMRIPTANGKAYAKLYNVTDKHDVWSSEVSAESSGGYRAESGEIKLDSGRKLYRVFMKSTMGFEAILDSARIKIVLE